MLSSAQKKALHERKRAARRRGIKIQVAQRRKAFLKKIRGEKKEKVKKEQKPIPPYRLIKMQARIDKLQQGIRALPHDNPHREKLVKRMAELSKRLGK